jgi:hypothetical protein
MENTELNLNQIVPQLYEKSNPKPTSLPLNVEEDLKKYSRIYITKEFDPFRLVHCCELMYRDYMIYGEIKGEHNVLDKKLLFTSAYHYKCCNCCEQCIIGCLCCGYACCDSIQFQMDYRRNGEPFYTQGINISKGCHCCDVCLLNCCNTCCAGDKLYLRENIDPDNPNIKVGNPKGFTEANCCCACDKFVIYNQQNNLRGQTVRAACCEICKNSCLAGGCCCVCSCCIQGCDFEMSIENESGIKTGNVKLFSGCCSEKTQGKFCYLPRPYLEVNMPPNSTSEQRFQIIADIIHLDLNNRIF